MFSHTTTTIKPTKPTTTPPPLQTTTTHSCSRNKKCTGNIDRVIVSCKSKSKKRMTRSTYKSKKRQKTKERRQREIKRNTEEISPKKFIECLFENAAYPCLPCVCPTICEWIPKLCNICHSTDCHSGSFFLLILTLHLYDACITLESPKIFKNLFQYS